MVALPLLTMVPATALKVAEVAAAATVTDPGTTRRLLLDVRETAAPPVGAGPLSVTVHVEMPRLFRAAGLQETELTAGNAPLVTVPPVAVTETVLAAGRTPKTLVTPIEVLVTPAAMVKFTTAMTPFAIIAWFKPEARQLYVPEPEAQVNVLAAAVAAAPALAEIDTTLLTG